MKNLVYVKGTRNIYGGLDYYEARTVWSGTAATHVKEAMEEMGSDAARIMGLRDMNFWQEKTDDETTGEYLYRKLTVETDTPGEMVAYFHLTPARHPEKK